MAVSVDTVYQRVLAFANKEQRGYVTPQEFNLFANQAQMEIFEQYFYDLNQFMRVPGNNTVYADVDDMLEEKMNIFERADGASIVAAYQGAGGGGINKRLPDYIYRISRVEFNNAECEILNSNDFKEVRNGTPLLRSSLKRPIVNIRGNVMRAVGSNNSLITPTGVFYFKKPDIVNWGYVVVNDKALYNDNISTDFELHPAEETELVYKILKFAGISIKQLDIMRAGQVQEQAQVQQEKQ